MAEVFLAQRLGEEGFSRTVAIKTILAHGAEEEAVRLFLDEARVAAALEHAAIVQTFDLGYENETLFIVMEYVSGPTLSRIVRDLKKKQDRMLEPAVVAHVGARVASALDYAHRRATSPSGEPLHLVHRDISPQNILLTRTGLVKLSDFGVARASIQTHKTKTGQVRGKAAYMAPEQVRAKQLDGRTDVFALGLVLFEALTARRAFHRKGDIQSMRAVLSDPVPPVRALNPDCPPELEAAVMRCVQKDPSKRFQTAAELEAALVEVTRAIGESRIEARITETIDELFGEAEMYTSSDSGPAVEAWQPTIAAQAQGVRPMRIGGRLDPEVARMLETPPTASRGHATPSSGGLDAPTPTPTHGAAPAPATPTPTGMQPGLPNGSYSGVGPYPFAEPPGTSTGVSGLTPTQSQTTAILPKKGLVRFGLPLLAALVGVVGMLGWRLLGSSPTPAPEPAAPAAAARAEPEPEAPAVVARPEPEPEPEVEAPRPRPATKRPPPPPAPAERAEPPAPRPERAKKPPTREAAPKGDLNKRLLTAARKLEARGDTETAKALKKVLMDLSLGAQPSAEDRALLRRAEASLR